MNTLNAGEKAHVLAEALPYIRRFSGKVVVIKYGGNAVEDPDSLRLFAEDVVLMRSVGMWPVVVHGGGPQIGQMMERFGKIAEFQDGLRVTDAETLDIARMVLVGKMNREIVNRINAHGPLALGISGEDAGLITASRKSPKLGFVGDVTDVGTSILSRLLRQDLISVIATIGSDEKGQAYNVNADTAAGAIAEAVQAEKLVYLTDIDGVRRDVSDSSTLLSTVNSSELELLLESGAIKGGMIPKMKSCINAVRHGVGHAHILDGRVPHALLLEIFTAEGVGTMVNK